jgi:dihydroorotate dehydrogenase
VDNLSQEGLSGKPLTALANQRVIEARAVTQLPIIGVGGILDAHDARERIVAGADLIQIYAGWIFKGPRLPKSLLQVDTRPVDFRLQ